VSFITGIFVAHVMCLFKLSNVEGVVSAYHYCLIILLAVDNYCVSTMHE